MAANVYVGNADLLAQTNAAADKANVLVGEAQINFATGGGGSTTANVYVGEANFLAADSGVVPNPANVYVGYAEMSFGAAPIDRTGYWVYRGGVLCPVHTYVYNAQGVLA